MDDALRKAFRAARYRFDQPDDELQLAVDVPNAALARLLQGRGADSMAVLTAFNPQGLRQDDAQNRAAQQLLMRDLRAAGMDFLQGRNEDPLGKWPVEESLLVPGIRLPDARMLAARHGQLAFLWANAIEATPRLMETAANT